MPVELSSPRLLWFDVEAQARAREVLGGLRRAYRDHITVNDTCDVHVHVGRMDGAAFSLLTLKRLATVLWLAEPTLRSIRNPNSENFNNKFTWGAEVRRYSRLATGNATADELGRLYPEADDDDGGDSDEFYRYYAAVACHRRVVHGGRGGRGESGSSGARPRGGELGRLLSGPQRQYRRLGFNFSAFGEEDERALRARPRRSSSASSRARSRSADIRLAAHLL